MSNLGHEGGVLKVSIWIRYDLKMSLYMGDILHLTSRFRVELEPTQILTYIKP